MSETYWDEDKQGGVIEVTQEDYEAALARSLAPDETLRPGRHRFVRGGFLKRHGITPEELAAASVQIWVSLPLDDDVLAYFKQRAAAPGALPYQTQINQELRRVMERGRGEAEPLASVKQQLLADRQFLEALAAEIAAQSQRQQAA